jgi:uncharacterized membrane protein YdbT with pleckstrin-like domain
MVARSASSCSRRSEQLVIVQACVSMESVALPAKTLSGDEHVVIHTRTHVKAMILPALAFILIAASVGAGAALIPREARPIGQLAIALLGVVLAIWLVLLPFLRWRTTTYTITNRRLITRSGILTKIGKDLPLNRINEVSYERSVIDRMLGCGSLNVQTAAEDGTIVLRDVPDVEHVSREITQLLFGPQGTQHPPARS